MLPASMLLASPPILISPAICIQRYAGATLNQCTGLVNRNFINLPLAELNVFSHYLGLRMPSNATQEERHDKDLTQWMVHMN